MTIPYRQQVEEISEIIEEIGNDWEIGFIENVMIWVGDFTEDQEKVIDKLYKRACESGL